MTQPLFLTKQLPVFLILSVLTLIGPPARAQLPEKFLHVTDNAFRSPVLHFEGQYAGRPVELDLIGTIHFAQPEYYDQVNHLLAGYDAVGVELVVPRGTELSWIHPQAPEAHIDFSDILSLIGSLQALLTEQLGLTSQLAAIDYRQEHFVLADIDAETILERLAEEPLGEMITAGDIIGIGLDLTNSRQRRELLTLAAALLAAKDRRLTGRRLLAEFFAKNADSPQLVPFGRILIEDRDRVAIDRVETLLAEGKSRVALLYGAAHLRDLSSQVAERFGLTFVGADWLTVWTW